MKKSIFIAFYLSTFLVQTKPSFAIQEITYSCPMTINEICQDSEDSLENKFIKNLKNETGFSFLKNQANNKIEAINQLKIKNFS